MLTIPRREFLERVNRHARPSQVGLEEVRVVLLSVIVGADIQEDSVVTVLEEIANQPLFDVA